MRLLGIGLHGIKIFCAFMELSRPIFHSFYDKLLSTIFNATDLVCKTSMEKAATVEKEVSARENTSGLVVSGDGSWRKRGFSSLFGLVSLIGWNTEKVIDIIIKSSYCKACEYTAEYSEWLQSHENNCEANHMGSAGKMEVDAVIEMFQRSESLYEIKYGSYIGDGDSKTFASILKSEPYENFSVQKKECLDHVQKRMGTRLRNLKKKVPGLGGKGKLTNKLIDELSIYYGLAIRRNHDSIEKMKNDIWATLYHKISTNEKPQHDKCPVGENSWCLWQKSKASNTLHNFSHKTALPDTVFNAIKPIYDELSNDDLLNRCLGGFTQNSNESFNATVWSMAPKFRSSGKTVLDIAGNLAVCTFNDGISSIMNVMKALDMTVGTNCYNFCVAADKLRIHLSDRLLSEAAKEARIALKSARKEEEAMNINMEGQLYGPGIAD
ncbi:hypothetical protein ALC57_14630 [Trachymyrmex cornetzi]|uniref:Mutator-like transposase domain-containing protein n=1 Tax=Trachymyrmex cornetzi TaxID=471704 RepID=A0A151IY11_9HYME|nr:hypothetical protein ALC57_14630 [Trachymyrmex cornetzi]